MRDRSSRGVLAGFDRLFRSGAATAWDDGELLRRYVSDRDEAAFEALVYRFGPMVLGLCRRFLNDPDDVADAFQASFLVLIRRAATIREPQLVGNWLYGVAVKVARRARSRAWDRRGRERPIAGIDGPDRSVGPAPDSEDWATLHEELARLPEKYRRPLVLCYLEGHTHDEAARRLAWPVGTVRGRMHRGRELLRRRLARRGLADPIPLIATTLVPPRLVVPPGLVSSTRLLARSAPGGVGGLLAAGTVPAGAVALAEGVTPAMVLTPVKLIGAGSIVALLGAAAVAIQTPQPALDLPNSSPFGGPAAAAAPVSSLRALELRVQGRESDLAVARARLELARSQAQRIDRLSQLGQVSPDEQQSVRAEVQIREAELRRALAELEEAMLAVAEESARTGVGSADPVVTTLPAEGATSLDPASIQQRLEAIEGKIDRILEHLEGRTVAPVFVPGEGRR